MEDLKFINNHFWEFIEIVKIKGIKKFKIKCKCCGEEKILSKAYIKNTYCYECERLIMFLKQCNKNNFAYISGFKGSHKNEIVKVKCLVCQEIKELKPQTIMAKKFCCSNCIFLKKQKDFKELVEKNNDYELLTPYKLDKEKVKVKHLICETIYEVTPNDFKAGYRCGHCYGKKRKTNEEFKEQLKKSRGNEYILVGEYISYSHKVLIEHVECGHQWSVQPTHIINSKSNCPVCSRKGVTSKLEKDICLEISNLITSDKIITNDRKILKGLELDCLIPSKKLAIEVNGSYWHSYPLKKKDYHYDKFENCLKEKINLFSIYEFDWINKSEVIKKELKYFLKSKIEKKINTEIKNISDEEFFKKQNEYSLENLETKSKFKLCSVDKNNNIIAIIAFGFNKDFCKINHFSGNFNELKKFEEYIINKYNPKEFRIEVSKNYLQHLKFIKQNYTISKNIKPKIRLCKNNKEVNKDTKEKCNKIYDSGSYLLIKNHKPLKARGCKNK